MNHQNQPFILSCFYKNKYLSFFFFFTEIIKWGRRVPTGSNTGKQWNNKNLHYTFLFCVLMYRTAEKREKTN